MTRTRPRRYRNCYRDHIWIYAVVRRWAAALGHVDLAAEYRNIIGNTTMKRPATHGREVCHMTHQSAGAAALPTTEFSTGG
jgi:hypothetical protein